MKSVAKWTGAIVLSLVAHGGAAMLFQPEPEQELIAGGEVTEVTMLGNAFEDTIEAGNPTDPVDPVETPVEDVQPVETEPVETLTEEISPVTEDIPAETAEAIQPTIADLAVPLEDLPPVTSEQPMVTAAVQPVEEIKPVEEPEPEKIEKPVEKKIVEKPQPKKKPEPKKKVEKKPERKKVVKKTSGAEGQSAQRNKKGTEQGVENAKSAKATGNTKSASQAGNAAVSNYPGKVRSKLNRAFRYPSAAQRERLRGTALVQFTVSSGGGVSGVRIARSAGSAVLDEAALATVRRAAPFAKIPDGAGRSSWTFTVPLSFTR